MITERRLKAMSAIEFMVASALILIVLAFSTQSLSVSIDSLKASRYRDANTFLSSNIMDKLQTYDQCWLGEGVKTSASNLQLVQVSGTIENAAEQCADLLGPEAGSFSTNDTVNFFEGTPTVNMAGSWEVAVRVWSGWTDSRFTPETIEDLYQDGSLATTSLPAVPDMVTFKYSSAYNVVGEDQETTSVTSSGNINKNDKSLLVYASAPQDDTEETVVEIKFDSLNPVKFTTVNHQLWIPLPPNVSEYQITGGASGTLERGETKVEVVSTAAFSTKPALEVQP